MCNAIIVTLMVVLVVSHTRAKSCDLKETYLGKYCDALWHILKESMPKNWIKMIFWKDPGRTTLSANAKIAMLCWKQMIKGSNHDRSIFINKLWDLWYSKICAILIWVQWPLMDLKPYTKHTAKLSNIMKKKRVIIGKKYNITVSQYAIILKVHFEKVSNKSKIVKQFVYNWLQFAKILSKL